MLRNAYREAQEIANLDDLGIQLLASPAEIEPAVAGCRLPVVETNNQMLAAVRS